MSGWIRTLGSLLVFGRGNLTASELSSEGDIEIAMGPSITILDYGDDNGSYNTQVGINADNNILITGCMIDIRVTSIARAIHGQNVYMLGAVVSIVAGGGIVSGKGGFVTGINGTTVIDGCVINMLTDKICWKGADLSVSHSCLSWCSKGVSLLDDVAVIYGHGTVSFDNSLVKFVRGVSPTGSALAYSVGTSIIQGKTISFGEGDYYLVSLPNPWCSGFISDAAIHAHPDGYVEENAGNVSIHGGNIQICVPDRDGVYAGRDFEITNGRLEIVDSIDVREMMKFDIALASIYTGGMLVGGLDFSTVAVNFYNQVFLDALSDVLMSVVEGTANAGIVCEPLWYDSDLNEHVGSYRQTGGTVWCDKAKYGIVSPCPIVQGGSCKSSFYGNWLDLGNGHDVQFDSPYCVQGGTTNKNLTAVVFSAPGAREYDKITSGLPISLPSYYGTSSLYADKEGKLYFWIPSSGDGGLGGGGSGGGSGGGGSGGSGEETPKIDLAFYKPDGWSQPVFLATAMSNYTAKTTIMQGSPVYLKYGIKNIASDADVRGFLLRFRLNTGVTFISDWRETTMKGSGYGWSGEWRPDELQGLEPGTYTLTCTLDADGAIAETNEDNNTTSLTFTVKAREQGVYDLGFGVPSGWGWPSPLFLTTSSSSTSAATSFQQGCTMCFKCGYANLADNGDDIGGFKIHFQLSSGETYVEDYWLTHVISVGNSGWTRWSPTTLKDLAPGTYTMTVTLDSDNDLDETDEGNNSRTISFTVTKAMQTVTFSAGSGTVWPVTRTVARGAAVGTLPTPTRSGYIFDGWYTQANGGTKLSASTTVTANMTCYAHWTSLASGGFSLSGAYAADKARTLSGAMFSGNEVVGVVSLKVGKANRTGVFKVSGTLTTLDGKKHTVKSGFATQGNSILTLSGIPVRDYGNLTLKLAANGFTGTLSNGWTVRTAKVDTLPTGTLTFDLEPYPTGVNGMPVKAEYLPRGQKLSSSGTKLTVPRAGRVSYKKGTFAVSAGGEGNPSGLKLMYAAKTGTLKGSFNFYTFNGQKLTRFTAKLTGVTVDGKGYMAVKVNRVNFSPSLKATLAR